MFRVRYVPLVILAALLLVATIAYAGTRDNRPHKCYAPCTVILPPNTEEDEFAFNYTWPDKNTSVVEVWKKGDLR